MTGNGRLDTYDGWWAWRDDLFTRGRSAGGKVRTCWALATQDGVKGLVTAGSRHSPQVHIVAEVAQHLGLPCAVHVPAGQPSAEVNAARMAGATVVQHRPGYNSVLVARAAQDSIDTGWLLIPFGMECAEAVWQNADAAAHAATLVEPQRVVVPVGSGMTLAGLATGLPPDLPILGVRVGASPVRRLDHWAPGWRERTTLVTEEAAYHVPVHGRLPDGTPLDPHYEAKAARHLQPGDLLWVVGLRGTLRRSHAARQH